VSKAIAMLLQKAWGICNAYENGTPVVDVFEFARLRGAGPVALMLGHEPRQHIYLMHICTMHIIMHICFTLHVYFSYVMHVVYLHR
jgi:hypothetical protein